MTRCSDSQHKPASLRTIWSLAWPQTLMMVAHFFIGFIDVLVAGKLGTEIQASLGMISQSLMFFLIIAIAVANGSVAAISQSLGSCLNRRAERYVGLSLMLVLAFSLTLLVVGTWLRDPFMSLIQVPENIRPITRYFLGVYLAILPAYYLLTVTNAIFRAHKWVRIPLYSMVLVTSVNTVADFGLGLGMWGLPNLGYKGVAWATFFSVLSGACFNLYMLRRTGVLSMRAFPPMRWIRRAAGYLVKVAWPSGASQILWQTGYLVLFAITAALPYENVHALAGMTAGMRVESALFLPAFAFNLTASILVGHALGADDAIEAKRVGYWVLGLGCGLISLCAVVVWVFIDPVTAFITPDAAVQAQARDYLFYNILAIPFTVASMILVGIMNGAGATLYTLAIFGSSTWLLRLPLAYVLGHLVMESSSGIWIAMLASQMVQSTVMLYFFQFKDWTRFRMRRRRPALQTPIPPAGGAVKNVQAL